MRNVKEQLVNILNAEVKPALGCTEPVAVALACAKAKELLGEEIVKHSVLVSPNVYKNGMCVGIPGTERLGLKISVALGFIGGHSENGLRVLETLTPEEVKRLNILKDAMRFESKYYINIENGKGGRKRISPIVGKNIDQIVERMKNTPEDKKVWEYVNSNADIHSYRADYATEIYKKYARRYSF